MSSQISFSLCDLIPSYLLRSHHLPFLCFEFLSYFVMSPQTPPYNTTLQGSFFFLHNIASWKVSWIHCLQLLTFHFSFNPLLSCVCAVPSLQSVQMQTSSVHHSMCCLLGLWRLHPVTRLPWLLSLDSSHSLGHGGLRKKWLACCVVCLSGYTPESHMS